MEQEKSIKKNLLKNTFINFLIFTVILLLFDIIIYNQVTTSLLKDVDEQLKNSEKIFSDGLRQEGREPREDRQIDRKEDEVSPRIINIVRDENGEIQDTARLGNLADFSDDIKFDSSNLNNIYNLKINGIYNYRAINIKIDADGTTMYMQILMNIDAETNTMDNIANILILATVILILISIVVSYILSKRNIKPIIEMYNKQTEFVQNASHELRTPLTIIQAKQELLLKNPNEKIIDRSEDINLTLKETRRLTKMIKELMDLARADEGIYKIEKEDINIDNLINDVISPYKDLANLQNKQFNLDLNYKKTIKGNRNKLTELLIIILDNAIKYTAENDKIEIKTSVKDRKCLIEIVDTGIGVDEKDINYIFDRFYRADKARSKETGGTGLGLSIAQTIVKMHDGTIKAIKTEPKGLTIQIKI